MFEFQPPPPLQLGGTRPGGAIGMSAKLPPIVASAPRPAASGSNSAGGSTEVVGAGAPSAQAALGQPKPVLGVRVPECSSSDPSQSCAASAPGSSSSACAPRWEDRRSTASGTDRAAGTAAAKAGARSNGLESSDVEANSSMLRAEGGSRGVITPGKRTCCFGFRGSENPAGSLEKELAGMPEEELARANAAVSRVQARWRGSRQQLVIQEKLRSMYSQPDLEQAKQYAARFLPKDRHGHRLPLTAPLTVFHPLGCGIALYFHMLHWWTGFSLATFLIVLPSMCMNVQGSALNVTGLDLFTEIQTLHTIGNADELTLAHGATEIVLVSLMVWFMFWQTAKTKQLSAKITQQDLSAGNYTVMVGRLPAGLRSLESGQSLESVQEFFAKLGEGDVVHIGVCFDYREMILCVQERKDLRQRLQAAQVAWYLAKANSYPKKRLLRATRACARAKHDLFKADTKLRALSQLAYSCTGHAFVTFDTVEAAAKCIAACKDKERFIKGAGPITAHMAPEPEDVLWENVQYSAWARWARSALSMLIAFVFVICSTIIILNGAIVQNDSKTNINAFLLTVAGIAILASGYILIFLIVPLMAYKIERHQTASSRERAIYVKLLLFQVLVAILPAIWFCEVVWDPFSIYIGQGFYTYGAKILIGAVVGDAFVINLLIDLGRPQDRISRWKASCARTQRQMRDLWKCDAGTYVAFRMQLASKWALLGFGLSSVVPALIPLTFVFFVISNWVDRYNILRALSPPPPEDDSIASFMIQVVVPIGVLLHMAVANVSFAMKEGALGAATICTIANSCVYGPLTLFFMVREHRARRGKTNSYLRLGRRLSALLEFYLDLPSGAGNGIAPTRHDIKETFREGNDLPYYIPPLTRVLLKALGEDAELFTSRGPPGKRTSQGRGSRADAEQADATPAHSKRRARGTRVAPEPLELPEDAYATSVEDRLSQRSLDERLGHSGEALLGDGVLRPVQSESNPDFGSPQPNSMDAKGRSKSVTYGNLPVAPNTSDGRLRSKSTWPSPEQRRGRERPTLPDPGHGL